MADDNKQPVFQIQRVYLKDLSLEQPNSPQILLEQAQPQVDINLSLAAELVADGIYEVAVTATVTTKVNDKVLFLVEAKQAGIFEIRNIPDDQLQPIIGIACPGIVYPYLRCRVGRLHPRRLPAGGLVGSEFPSHVRSAARASRVAERRHPRQLNECCPCEPDRPRRRRLGHGTGDQHQPAARDAAVGA